MSLKTLRFRQFINQSHVAEKTSNEIGANKPMKKFFSLTCAICLDSYVIARDLCGLLIINIFSLYVLFSHSRPRDGTPDNCSFKCRHCRRRCAYSRNIRSIYFEKVNFIENITWSKLGKRNLQTKKVFSKHEIGERISKKAFLATVQGFFFRKTLFTVSCVSSAC